MVRRDLVDAGDTESIERLAAEAVGLARAARPERVGHPASVTRTA
jgi:hypothetical protein